MHNKRFLRTPLCSSDSILPGVLSNVCGGSQSVGGLGNQRARDLLGFRLNVHAQHQLKALLITRGHWDSCWTHRL